jgi:DNA-binding GntR family transcriptional regulator
MLIAKIIYEKMAMPHHLSIANAKSSSPRRPGHGWVNRSAKPDKASNVTALTKTSLVYSDLRARILCGDLEPGKRLVIRRIAERHGVSDIPVREALRLLEKDNLIKCHPYGSAFVREASDDEIYEIFFIRGLLESAATQLCVNFVSGVTLRRLEVLCEKMEKCTVAKDIGSYSKLNREFHRTIFNALPFTKLTNQIEDLWQSYGWLQLTFRFQPGRMAESNQEHARIVYALRKRSMAAAGRAAFEHKQNARRAFVAARKRSRGKLANALTGSDPIVEEIEMLCDLWQETQWLADVRPAGVSGRVASMTRRLSRNHVNGKAKNGSTKAKPKGLNR